MSPSTIEYRVVVVDEYPDTPATPDGIGFVIECREVGRTVWSVLDDRPFMSCEAADEYASQQGYTLAENYQLGDPL